MAAFTSLPADIAYIIIQLVVDHTVSNEKAVDAKIPLLAVCREWRAIVVPLFYNQAYFRSYKQDDFSPHHLHTCFAAQTNIGLILQSGYANCVKSIDYSSKQRLGICSLMHMARLLDISTDNCPELDSLMDYHGKNSNTRLDMDNDKHVTAAATIATALASKLPNTKQLDIDITGAHTLVSCFLSALMDCFADKLVQFNFTGPSCFSTTRQLTGLRIVSLCLFGDRHALTFPSICPRSIQRLSIITDRLIFNWGTFGTGKKQKNIVFDELKYFYCRFFRCGSANSRTKIYPKRILHFPNIKKTSIGSNTISVDTIERQLRSGLRELEYLDDISKMLELSELDLSGLVNLKLEYAATGGKAHGFIAHNNVLFEQLKGIPIVQSNITSFLKLSQLSEIYWPNLTHVVVRGNMMLGCILKAALKMPNLVYLKVISLAHSYVYDGLAPNDYAITYLDSLRRDHSTPSASNIEHLQLEHAGLVPSSQLKSAIQALKWYWPKLHTIDIFSELVSGKLQL